MPLIRLTVPDHLPPAPVRALADAVHQALVDCCGVPVADRFILITRLAGQNMLFDPHYPNVTRSADACVVDITLLGGRTPEQKQRLYRHIAAGAQQAGLRADDVLVALSENSAIDWSLGRGLSFEAANAAHTA